MDGACKNHDIIEKAFALLNHFGVLSVFLFRAIGYPQKIRVTP